MAVPSSAYQSERVCFRGLGDIPIAKFTGVHNTVANAKAKFYLDYVYVVRKNGSDYGFIGLVKEGGTNIERHPAAYRGRSRIRMGGSVYFLLNDAGLNLLPRIGISIVSRWANWAVVKVSVTAPTYNAVTAASVSISQLGQTYNIGAVSAGTTKEASYAFTNSTSSNSGSYQPGMTYRPTVSATNDQGTETASSAFVSGARVLYPRGMLQFFSTSNPTSLSQVSGNREYDIYETDYRDMIGIGINLYTPPGGSNPPTMTTPLAAGWYHSSAFDEAYETYAFKVGSTGAVVDVKEISDGQTYTPRIGIYVRVGTDRYDSNCYAIEYSISGSDLNVLYKTYDTIRCVIKGSTGGNSSTHYAFAIQSAPSGGTIYYPRTNVWGGSGVNITLVLKSKESTQGGSSYYTIRGIGKGSNNGSTWMDLNAGKPSSVTNLYSLTRSTYCTLQARVKSSGQWVNFTTGATITYASSYVNENTKY